MKKIFIFSISLICFLGKSQSNSPIPKSIENQKTLKWADYYLINGEDEKSITFYSENENDLSADQRDNKVRGDKLENYPLHNLPKYLQDNSKKYQEWID